MMVSGSGVRQVPMFLLCGFGAATTLLPGSPVYLYGRAPNGAEQPGIRPKPSRSQPDLGPARPRSGCHDGAIFWILGSGYHRNARKQSERGVPPGAIETMRWFSDTLDRTDTSRAVVGVGLFNLGLVFMTKGPRDDCLMQGTTGIE
jgi:hypothetical protein